MLTLVIAGEMVFSLPFHTARFFRPTFLEVFNISVTELGDAFAIYGIVAMLSYFPGGALADRYSARTLIAASLFGTAFGGLYLMTIPGYLGLSLVYGFWGFTTVCLLWGALLRATRIWGGTEKQGLAFGALEGGRGLVSSLAALLGVVLLAIYLPDDATLATDVERRTGFQRVLLSYTALTLGAGILALVGIPKRLGAAADDTVLLHTMRYVARRPVIWAQAAIVVCAYCLFKGLDNYSLYANVVLGFDEVEAALMFNYGSWTRPAAAILAGLLADRVRAVVPIAVLFVGSCLLYVFWSFLDSSGIATAVVLANFFITFAAVFALRGVYFVLVEENKTPIFATGAAVGLVSLIGFTPDIFFAPIAGRILDANPGLVGFQHYFLFLGSIAVIGALMVLWLVWLRKRGDDKIWPTFVRQ